MPSPQLPNGAGRSLWAGRTLALVGIILVAINLRTAVAAVSPIAAEIRAEIPMDSLALGLNGALPPIAFATSGFIGPGLARMFGLEWLVLISISAMVAGHLMRGWAPGYLALLGGSVVTFVGIGIANILLPPLVKRYFPDRIGQLTAVYVLSMSISTAVPAMIAAPIANTAGWRVSLGMWSILALMSAVPWGAVLLQRRRDRIRNSDILGDLDVGTDAVGPMWRSRTAWLIAMVMGVSALHVYATFAWGPQMLIEIAGVTPVQAGLILAVYSLGGVPAAVFAPTLAARVTDVGVLVYIGIGFFLAGYLGLLISPASAPLLWMGLAGLGPLLFPVALVLINLRSRTPHGAVALSAFVQGAGYGVAMFGPILVGGMRDITGGWTLALTAGIVTALACIVPARRLRHSGYVEDELAAGFTRRPR